jgi:hypothetical protein
LTQRRRNKVDTGRWCCPPPAGLSILDIGTTRYLRIIANLALPNLIAVTVNLAISPTSMAIVASSVVNEATTACSKQVPTTASVIDLTTNTPALIDTVTVGETRPACSSQHDNLALVANRADNSVSVLRITGKVRLIDTVAMGESVAHVRFTPT